MMFLTTQLLWLIGILLVGGATLLAMVGPMLVESFDFVHKPSIGRRPR